MAVTTSNQHHIGPFLSANRTRQRPTAVYAHADPAQTGQKRWKLSRKVAVRATSCLPGQRPGTSRAARPRPRWPQRTGRRCGRHRTCPGCPGRVRRQGHGERETFRGWDEVANPRTFLIDQNQADAGSMSRSPQWCYNTADDTRAEQGEGSGVDIVWMRVQRGATILYSR